MAASSSVDIIQDDVQEVHSEPISFAMFKRFGASIAIGSGVGTEGAGAKGASLLAVSNAFGATFLADPHVLYAARTALLLELADAAKSSGDSQIQGKDGVRRVRNLEGVHTLSLSADELLLAVCVNKRCLFFSTQDLLEKESPAPRFHFDLSVRSITWSPTDARTVLALRDDDILQVVDVSKGMKGPRRERVVAASWSPDGRHVAFASTDGVVSVVAPDLSTTVATIRPALAVAGEDSADHVKIDSLRWVRPGSILLSLVPINEDGSEAEESPLIALETPGSSFSDGASAVRELLFDGLSPCIQSEATAANTGPYLHSAYVEPWNVVLVANRKSYDDHINLVGWREMDGQEALRQWQIEDDGFLPRVDMPESGADPFVVGLAVDRTSVQIQLDDPRAPEEKLPPQPIMLYMTSEGLLSAFVFARLDKANNHPDLVRAPRATFAPLENLQTPPKELKSQGNEEPQSQAQAPFTPPGDSKPSPGEFQPASNPPEGSNRPEKKHASQTAGGAPAATSDERKRRTGEPEKPADDDSKLREKPSNDVSKLRAAAAEAAERRAAEARLAQSRGLPQDDDDAELLDEPSTPSRQAGSRTPTPSLPPNSEGQNTAQKPDGAKAEPPRNELFAPQPPVPSSLPGSDGKQVIKTLDNPESVASGTSKPAPVAPQPPIPATLPGSEGKRVIKPLEGLVKPEGQIPATFAAQPPVPAFLPGSQGKQVIKTLETQTQNAATSFAAQPPIPASLPGSQVQQVIKTLQESGVTHPPPQKPGAFAAQPPVPSFLPGSNGKEVIRPREKPDGEPKPQTSAATFAAQPPIPAFLPGSEKKQAIKPLHQSDGAKPQPPNPAAFAAQPPIPAFLPGSEGKQAIKSLTKQPSQTTAQAAPSKSAASPVPSPFTGQSVPPFGGSASSASPFGGPAFGGFAPSSPFGFSGTDTGQESGRSTPAFGTNPSTLFEPSDIKPSASGFAPAVSPFGQPAQSAASKPSRFGGFSGAPSAGGGFSSFSSPGGFSSFAAKGPVSDPAAIPEAGSKTAHKQLPSQQGPRESLRETGPSSPKRVHPATDSESDEALKPSAQDVKRPVVRTAGRGQGSAQKAPPQEKKKPDEEAEFVKELEEVQHMAANLDALLAPLKGPGLRSSTTVLSRDSLDDLFKTTAALYQECLDLQEQLAEAGRNVQDCMAATHQADAWRIVLASKVEQARDERFRVLWDEKGLEPKVEAQRKALQTKDQVLKRKLTELQIHLQTLELRQKAAAAASPARVRGFGRTARMHGHPNGTPQRGVQSGPSVQSLYSTVNSQMAVAHEQASRLTHLMTQLGLGDRNTPPKPAAEGTPRAEKILRSLDISPPRGTPRGVAGRTPKSSGRRTGTVFRAPDFDDCIDDVSPSKTPLPKQRLTYSPAGSNRRVGTPGPATPPSARHLGTPNSATKSPPSERRVLREGLSNHHVPTTTIKRGVPPNRAQPPPSPVAYPGPTLVRRPSGHPQLSEEDSRESVRSDGEETDVVSEGEQRQAERRQSRRGSQAFSFSGGTTGAPAHPPETEERLPGGTARRGNDPPTTKNAGSGSTHSRGFSLPASFGGQSVGFGSVERVVADEPPAKPPGFGGFGGFQSAGSNPFEGFGTGAAAKPAAGPPGNSAPSFGGFSFPVKTISMGAKSGNGSQPSPFATSTFTGFGAPASSSSKTLASSSPQPTFDGVGAAKPTSAASVPVASFRPGDSLASADVAGAASSKKGLGLPPAVKLTSAVSAPPQPRGFPSFAALAESADVTRRADVTRGADVTSSADVARSADVAKSADVSSGASGKNRKREGSRKRSDEEVAISDDEGGTSDETRGSQRQTASERQKTAPRTDVSNRNDAQSAPAETSKPPAPAFTSFGGSAGAPSAFSSFAKKSAPFGFSSGTEGVRDGTNRVKDGTQPPFGYSSGTEGVGNGTNRVKDGTQPPSLFGTQAAASSPFAAFGTPGRAASGIKTSNPLAASTSAPPTPPSSSESRTDLRSTAGEKADQPEDEPERKQPEAAEPGETQQAGAPATGPGEASTEQSVKGTVVEPKEAVSKTSQPGSAAVDTKPPEPGPTPDSKEVSVSNPPEPESPRTPTANSSSPFAVPPPQPQPLAAPLSSTPLPVFTPSSPVAPSPSPFGASAGVNAPSPFAFAQAQTLTQPTASTFVSPPSSPTQTTPPPVNQTSQEGKEESMDEEDPSGAGAALGGFGGFGGFGLGSATPADPSKPNPFGLTSFPNPGPNPAAPSTPPSDPNALFKPASFALPGGSSPFAPAANPSGFGANPPGFAANPPSPFGAPSSASAFGQTNTGSAFGQSSFGQSPSAFGQAASPGFGGSGFGQPASPGGFGSPGQIGAAASSNQVIGGIVGGFGQSRTLGPALPGVAPNPAFGSAPTAGAFGSFAAKPSGGFGGFASQSTGGGFAAAASPSGSGFGGFGGAPSGGGFSGFAGAASQGGGFGGLGGSPNFGGSPSGADPRFTQIRK